MGSQDKKRKASQWFLIIATFITYIILTGSKNLYVAEKTTMTEAGFNSVKLASTMEYYFYAYAVMQIALVFLMKKINVKWYLLITIILSGALTLSISFTKTVTQQWIIYIVNGVMQAGIWGCSLHVLSKFLSKDVLPKANALMSSAPPVASVISYGTAAAFGENWRLPFLVLGIALIISVCVFFIAVNNMKKYPREIEYHHVVRADGSEEDVTDEEVNDFIHLKNKKRKGVFYAISIFYGLLITFLFFSLNNVVDYFIVSIGGYDNTVAKIMSMVILVITVIGPIVTVRACEKYTNFLKVGLVFFGIALLCSVALLALTAFKVKSFFVLLFFYLLFLIVVNGGRSISLSIAALRMRDKIDTGVYSTVVNAASSVTAGIAPKIFTMIIKPEVTEPMLMQQNWINAFTISVALGTVTVISILALIIWVKKLNKKDAILEKEN